MGGAGLASVVKVMSSLVPHLASHAGAVTCPERPDSGTMHLGGDELTCGNSDAWLRLSVSLLASGDGADKAAGQSGVLVPGLVRGAGECGGLLFCTVQLPQPMEIRGSISRETPAQLP